MSQKITGVQRFATEISKHLKQSPQDKFICFLAPPNIIHPELAKELQVKVIGSNTGHLWEQLDLVRFLRAEKNPILLNLANSAPLFYTNNVVTIHDLSVYFKPKWFSFPYRTYYKFLTPVIVKSAKLVFTVSYAIKEELIKKFNLSPGRIEVIYNAVSKELSKNNIVEDRKRGNYILTVSSLDPRKNIKNLILAFSRSAVKDHNLYIIGGKSAAFAKTELQEIVQKNKQIKLLGRVSDEELLQLYSNAKLFAYVSFYEGFGLPNIEAMAMGTPVLTSDTPAIKEICEEAAYYVKPNDVEDISSGIFKLLNSPELLKELSSKGIKKSKEFSWTNSANKLLNAISTINAGK